MCATESDHDYPFDAAHTAASLLDGAGTVVAWTAAAETLLQRPGSEVCGRPVRDLLAEPSTWAAVLAQRTGPPEEVWDGTAALRRGSGDSLEVTFHVIPLHASAGKSRARFLLLGAPTEQDSKWRQDLAFTQELFLQGRIGLAVFDEHLRLLRTNTQLLPYTGVPDDLSGRRLADFLRAEDAGIIDERLQEVLTSGEPLVGFNATVRTLDDPGAGRVMTLSAFRLQGPSGQLMGVAAVFNDVTDHERARARLDLLHRATAVLSGSLSLTRGSEDLAAVLAPALGDCVAVDLAEEVFSGSEPAAVRSRPLVLRRTAVAGHAAEGLRTGVIHSTQNAPLRAREGRGTLVTGNDAPSAGGQPPRWSEGVPTAHSAMIVPMTARGTLLGQVTVWRTGKRPPLDRHHLSLLEEIATRAALAVDNGRRYTRERLTAVALQRSLLPPATTDTPAVEAASVYLPTDAASGVGGDWFDVFPLSSARVALVVGDVAGHGLHATAMMGRLRSAVRALADLELEPAELLVHLDDLILQLTAEAEGVVFDEGPAQIAEHIGPVAATCLYAVYDPVTRLCVMASAGHPPPAVVVPNGTVRYVELSPGPPLGVGGWPFEMSEAELPPGSVMALYTDGLIERDEGDIDEGMRGLADRLVRADVLGRPLRDARHDVVADLPPGRLADDVTLLLARTRLISEDSIVTWQLDADPAVVSDARHLVTRQLSEWDLDELAFTTELIASELVTNAIRYAGGPVRLRLIRAGALTCEVSDPSNSQPRMRRARSSEEGGRGLYLVAQLSHRWGSRYTREGKTVWSEQPLPLQ
ncbi:SpoIIE family protein phosphatase [Streptomyces sp. NPDC006208]|uniref:SpoIIE family protein phosphatase n=1 Tax=Streptomyces sp. NPDC006208 TaxID=3156734 RepID=UPI0033B6FA48